MKFREIMSNRGGQCPPYLLQGKGPHTLDLPNSGFKQKYVPLRALSLIKIACSVCPAEELPQVSPAINWLMTPEEIAILYFMVMYAFTPGLITVEESEVNPLSIGTKVMSLAQT